MDLERKVELMKKYDFSKFSLGFPGSSVEEKPKNEYPLEFRNALRSINFRAFNLSEGIDYNLLESLNLFFSSYGFAKSCYDSIEFDEIREDPDFLILREINAILPIIGQSICHLTYESAMASYVITEPVKRAAKELQIITQKALDLNIDDYRIRVDELIKQLEQEKGDKK
jgi:hypothetical protein